MKNKHVRHIGPFALMLTGLGSIIGSGWLFGAARAANIAGPAAVVAWIGGMLIILSIALSYAELGAMFPEAGGMVRYARYSHGSMLGFIAAWSNWIAIVSVIPVEAEASIQYMSTWPYPWAHGLYVDGELSTLGLFLAALLVIVYFLINYWGVKLYAKTNTYITSFKLVVPALAAIALFYSGFHSENFSTAVPGGFAPFGWSAVMTAIATSGIVFSYNGFQSPINMAGEAINPGRNVPLGVIGSILLAAAVYIALQVAFIGALSPSDLINGWHGLNFSSPFAQLAMALGLNWLVFLLYADAFISPSGTGATYMATTTRMIYGMERNGTMPKIFGQIHPLYHIPRQAMWFNLAVAYVFLFFFRSWNGLAAVISVATVISYLTGPVCVASLRRTAGDLERPLKLPYLDVLAPFAFVFSSLVLYWARWPLTGKIILLIVAALPIYFWYQAKDGCPDFRRELKGALWMMAYLFVIAVLSYCGSSQFGGINLLPYGTDMVMVAVVSLGFYYWGIQSGWRTRYLNNEHNAHTAGDEIEEELRSKEDKLAGLTGGTAL